MIALAATVIALAVPAPAGAAAKPNLLFVLTDDQRADSMSVMPATRHHFDVKLGTAIATTPLCCPSRVSMLTGRYAHDHGVTNNDDHSAFDAADALPVWLQEQGYYTGFVGKYLNHYVAEEPVPPGWDEFHARVRVHGTEGHFFLRELSSAEDGIYIYDGAYGTRLYASLAARFIRRAHDPAFNPEAKPWALFVWVQAPHSPLVVEDRYRGAVVPRWRRPPSLFEADISDKPAEIRKKTRRLEVARLAFHRAQTLRMLMSVDDLVDRLFSRIDDYGEAESTWGLYSSDNGLMGGEHRLVGKLFAYEESIGVPFRLAVPGVGAKRLGAAVAANIDVAPTLLALAGGGRDDFDGRSLASLALGAGPCFCHRTLMVENWYHLAYSGLRMPRWTYVEWASGHRELYNLRRDPWQLRNIAARRPNVRSLLHRKLTLLAAS